MASRRRNAALVTAAALIAVIPLAGGWWAGEGATANTRMTAPLLPGVGSHDPRGRLDPDKAPWRAVGKLQAASSNLLVFCTGTLVGPSTVLTAAHCVYNTRTQNNFLPSSLHFLIGYSNGGYVGHAVGIRIVTGPGYDPSRPIETLGSDWALVWLDTGLPSTDRALSMTGETPEVGSTVMLGGYQQDHPLVLMADTECRIVGRLVDAGGRTLLRHNCTGTRGVSGAPLLLEKGGKWQVAGVDVTAETGIAGGAAVVPDEPRKRF